MERLGVHLWLFTTNFFISAFTFGGGYVVIPMIRKSFVAGRGCFSEAELMDMAAVAQSSPGAIAVNLAALAGRRAGGAVGFVVGAVAAVLPPLIVLSLVTLAYDAVRSDPMVVAATRGMEAGAAALIADLVVDMCRTVYETERFLAKALVPAAFAASFFFEANVALILAGCALASLGAGVFGGPVSGGTAND